MSPFDSDSHPSRATHWAGGIFAVLVFIGVCAMLVTSGAEMHAAADAEKAREIDQENQDFCRKYGVGPETPRYTECSADLMSLRKRMDERHARDSFGLL